MTAQPHPLRDQAVRVITRVIKRVGTADRQALAAAISESYPFGESGFYPYRVWLDEVKKHLAMVEQGRFEPHPPAPTQYPLFDMEHL